MTGMPLVVVSGIPSSGKTRRVQELVEFLGNNCDREVTALNKSVYTNGCTVEPFLNDTPEIRTPLY